jgi:hypothetical protein
MMGKHSMERHKTNWRFTLRYYKYRIEFHLGKLVKAYISRGKA